MQKRIMFIGFVIVFILAIMFIGLASSETTTSDILSQIKKSSSGVSFSDNGFGGVKININSVDNKISYRDLHGNEYVLTGLLSKGELELDSKGNIIRANFASSKSLDAVLAGNIKANIPANSQLAGVDGKNFDVSLAPGSGVANSPVELFPNENTGNNLVNYKVDKKSNIKFPDFSLQEGVISHNGKYFILKGGNTAVVNGVSLYSLGKDGDNPVFFDEKKISEGLKSGYSVVDFKTMLIKNVGGDGKTQTIIVRPGNPIVPVNDNNKFGFKAGQQGQVNVQSKGNVIYPYVQGKFVMQNGNLYLYRQANGLVGSFNNQNGKYEAIPVDMSFSNADGSILLRDKDGHALGLMIKQGQNGWPQIQTGLALSPENPNPLPQQEMPNWQHNPDNSPVSSPITPVSTPITPPANINPPASQYPFTKEQFYRDIHKAPTSFLVQGLGYGSNLGIALQTVDPKLFEKHFGRGSMTTVEEAIKDYKTLIDTKAPPKSYTREVLMSLVQKNQKDLYNKYGAYLGFK